MRDIRIITDNKTGKSKGMAFVEFYDLESVKNAITLKKKLKGSLIQIDPSNANKNRSNLGTRPKPARPYYQLEPPTKKITKSVLVKNLVGRLADMTEADLRNLFKSFGQIEGVDLEIDPSTGKNRGEAIIKFARSENATLAIKRMNGYVVNNEVILVTQLPPHLAFATLKNHHDGDEPRPRLKEGAMGSANTDGLQAMINPVLAQIQNRVAASRYFRDRPSKVIGLFNLFGDEEAMDADKAHQLKKEVKKECRRFGDVRDIYVDHRKHRGVFVEFAHRREAEDTFKAFNMKMFDERPIYCAYFDKEIMM